jgi:hypothetical protein
MPLDGNPKAADGIRRKLRALTAMFSDPAATEPEKANAERLKARLEQQLPEDDAGQGRWTDAMFRLGKGIKEIKSPPPSPKGDWTDHAYRLGRMLRRGIKK